MTFPKKDESGSWYTLSNGDRVQGKANAEAAEAALGGSGDTLSRYGNPYAKVDIGPPEEQPKARVLAKVVEQD